MWTLPEKERISVRISERKEAQVIHEDEVQGQIANQGKPPLDAYLDLIILLLHYYQFYKLHGLFIYVSGPATRCFIIPPLRVQPSLIPNKQIPVSDMVLNTLSSLSPLFKEKSDYRLGALEKWLRKLFSWKEVFEKTLEWGSPAQVWVYEKEKVFGKKNCWRQVDKIVFEKLWWLST